MSEVIIIGGGASGMAAAIRAACGGHHVTLLERQARVGRKLLATGNGRCNLTNTGAGAEPYCGADPAFPAKILARYTPDAVMDLFADCGLKTTVEYGGRVYPYSDQAGSVVDVLRLSLERRGVAVVTGAAVETIRPGKNGFTVSWDGGGARADKAVVACGGCAGGKLGGVRDGYRLLESLGHSVTPLRPALCPLRTSPEFPRALKGVRVSAVATLSRRNGDVIGQTEGDVLFTETGLSGSAIFDLSLYHALHEGELRVTLNFFPSDARETVRGALAANAARWPEEPANRVFTGLLQSRLGTMLCKYAGVGGNMATETLTEDDLDRLADAAQGFSLPVTGTGGFDNAQITVGGVQTSEFNPETLQSRLVPGLYACGEVLDVAARCGGFNLHWAWASGFAAGELR